MCVLNAKQCTASSRTKDTVDFNNRPPKMPHQGDSHTVLVLRKPEGREKYSHTHQATLTKRHNRTFTLTGMAFSFPQGREHTRFHCSNGVETLRHQRFGLSLMFSWWTASTKFGSLATSRCAREKFSVDRPCISRSPGVCNWL